MKKLYGKIELVFKDDRKVSIYFISLFSGWFLALAFQGPVLIGRMEDMGFIIPDLFVSGIVFAHFIGLIFAGTFIKPAVNFKQRMTISLMICLVGNVFIFLPFTETWVPAMIVTSFFGGFVIAGWGHYYNTFAPSGKKLAMAAAVIVFSNVIMAGLIAISVVFSSLVGLFFSSGFLIASCLIFCMRVSKIEVQPKMRQKVKSDKMNTGKAFVLLFAFVTLLSVNSGFMYYIIRFSFSQHGMLVGVYWVLPYIAVVYLLSRLHKRLNMSYVLYAAIMIIGVAYILYFILDQSVVSYILVNTLLLGAFGVCDLFWWTVFGELLAFSKNPVKTFGVGLSANVLGILIGLLIGEVLLLFEQTNINPIIVALVIVFLTLFSLPMLYNRLALVLDGRGFLVGLSRATDGETEKGPTQRQVDLDIEDFLKDWGLTEREVEIANMLYRGSTYKLITKELNISENTVKTHVKNVYSKLGVSSKSELIEITSARHQN